MIKAIETVYSGYKFRSRLEARWAVFFDEIGIEWRYEVEGFEFEGQRYLPDFWLPTAEMWIEIKPKGEKLPLEYLDKLKLFSSEINQPLIALCGEPYRWEFDAIIFPASLVIWLSGATSFSFVDFIIVDKEITNKAAGRLDICFIKESGEPIGLVKLAEIPGLIHAVTYLESYDIVEQAYLTARQARFGKDGRG